MEVGLSHIFSEVSDLVEKIDDSEWKLGVFFDATMGTRRKQGLAFRNGTMISSNT